MTVQRLPSLRRRSSKRPVCVTGMGRCGTSLTTRLIGLLGVDLGPADRMLPAEENDNARGCRRAEAPARALLQALKAPGIDDGIFWDRPRGGVQRPSARGPGLHARPRGPAGLPTARERARPTMCVGSWARILCKSKVRDMQMSKQEVRQILGSGGLSLIATPKKRAASKAARGSTTTSSVSRIEAPSEASTKAHRADR